MLHYVENGVRLLGGYPEPVLTIDSSITWSRCHGLHRVTVGLRVNDRPSILDSRPTRTHARTHRPTDRHTLKWTHAHVRKHGRTDVRDRLLTPAKLIPVLLIPTAYRSSIQGGIGYSRKICLPPYLTLSISHTHTRTHAYAHTHAHRR